MTARLAAGAHSTVVLSSLQESARPVPHADPTARSQGHWCTLCWDCRSQAHSRCLLPNRHWGRGCQVSTSNSTRRTCSRQASAAVACHLIASQSSTAQQQWVSTVYEAKPLTGPAVAGHTLQASVPCVLSGVCACGACRFTPWVHLHGVMWSKWWLERNPEWQQLSKKWTPPMGGNAGW